ncbi:MAG: MliC family protein [Candidatus Paceibacterota bacterium]|jgi:membrane-bound inhibitor of C-type lysozyme
MKKFIAIFIGLLVVCFGGWYLAIRLQTQNKAVPEKPVASVFYVCNGEKTIQAEYYKGTPVPVKPGEPPVPTGSVRLKFDDGRLLALPQTISADGTRYANTDESFVFWGKGNGAMILENGAEPSSVRPPADSGAAKENYIGCVKIAPEPAGSGLSQIYTEPSGKFSLRLPPDYAVVPSYKYEMEPDKTISGIKFLIPQAFSRGTNLSEDSYISVESLPETDKCAANLFLYDSRMEERTENGTAYSVASSTDAGAGNRYEETVYAFPETNPCVAIRYFIHYMVFENYAPGMVKEFNKSSLIQQFDQIRSTLILR